MSYLNLLFIRNPSPNIAFNNFFSFDDKSPEDVIFLWQTAITADSNYDISWLLFYNRLCYISKAWV